MLTILRQELATAPERARVMLRVALIGFAIGMGLVVVDVLNGTNAEEAFRLLALSFGLTGLALLGVGQAAHALSQRGAQSESGALQMRPQQMHRLLLAVPVLLLAAASFLAIGIGLLIRALPFAPLHLISIALFAGYLWIAIRGVGAATRFLYRHAREQADAAMQARAAASEARLAALQSQMNPHFLFNALNTVASLVRTDPGRAEETVENLAQVLRRTLERSMRPLSTVGEELDYLRAYLDVERERWGDRLRVEWQIEPGTESARVPTLTLQPLVENSLKHGLGARRDGGTVEIAVQRRDGALLLVVSDDGEGFAPRLREGTGLGNLRERLSTLYGEQAHLRLDSGPGPGARITVEVPLPESTAEGGAGAPGEPAAATSGNGRER